MQQEKLSGTEINTALANLPQWQLDAAGKVIRKTFVFGNFREAFAFMTQSALMAEKLDHHPEWSNVYKTVEVGLTTHDADGLTALDIKLANAMDRAAA